MSGESDRWVTVREAAKILGLSSDMTYALCAAKKILHRRVGIRGGRIQVSTKGIQDYFRSCEVRPVENGNDLANGSQSSQKSKPAHLHSDGSQMRERWRKLLD